ncbi:hypothetical protein FHS16_005407 [Paenibacillus endophyticus]|uniref:Uncharacterized protein n=1 Tax=Paenibacillus endophyticus TaxID=1294268 RepID=A0A7W5CEA6_9BACL|nr:hypothetical protein [Paenibacillus endophyticus]MBB3155299.1 hypothetical protein [Paenibacillus endophyticus]
MKRSRYKRIAASVGISSLLAIGSVYAQSNESLLVQDWYKDRSHQLTAQILNYVVVEGLLQASQSVSSASGNLADNADAYLSNALSVSLEESKLTIQSSSQAYIGQIGEKASELARMTKEQTFEPYIRTVTNENNEALEQLAEATIKELTQQLDGGEARVDSN